MENTARWRMWDPASAEPEGQGRPWTHVEIKAGDLNITIKKLMIKEIEKNNVERNTNYVHLHVEKK